MDASGTLMNNTETSMVLYEPPVIKENEKISYLKDLLARLGEDWNLDYADVVREAIEPENQQVMSNIIDGDVRVAQDPNAAQPMRFAMAQQRKSELLQWLRQRLNEALISKQEM